MNRKISYLNPRHERRIKKLGIKPQAFLQLGAFYAGVLRLKYPITISVIDSESIQAEHVFFSSENGHRIRLARKGLTHSFDAYKDYIRLKTKGRVYVLNNHDRVWVIVSGLLHELRHAWQYENNKHLYIAEDRAEGISDRVLAYEFASLELDARCFEMKHIIRAVKRYTRYRQREKK